MADKILKEKRKLFIHSVSEGTINGLLDELLEKRVLNEEEMEKVKRENATVMDKARALFDSVIRKGARACQIFIAYICEEDRHLAGTLGLSETYNMVRMGALVDSNILYCHSVRVVGAICSGNVFSSGSAGQRSYAHILKPRRKQQALLSRSSKDMERKVAEVPRSEYNDKVGIFQCSAQLERSTSCRASIESIFHQWLFQHVYTPTPKRKVKHTFSFSSHREEEEKAMADKILKEKRKLLIRSVGEGTLNGLLDELLEKRVLNEEEIEKVKRENATVMDKARALFDSVIRKGDPACQVCITYICEEDCHLAEKLCLSADPIQCSGTELAKSLPHGEGESSGGFTVTDLTPQAVQKPPTLPPSGSEGNIKLCSPEKAERIKKEQSAEIYPIMDKSSRTRLALIICNEEFDSIPRRTGAEVDITGMTTLLENLGYRVDVRKNLTASEMTTELQVFAHRPEHKTSDSTFLVFMSHGTREGICGKKYSEQVPDILQVDEIFRNLNTRNCPSLKDKPKVIIIQACRGENQGVVWLKDSGGVSENTSLPTTEAFEDDAIRKAHIEKDFIAFCSSTPVSHSPVSTWLSVGPGFSS
ncbi:hypothetical protein P7K49_020753 [Saguinus oedipus]|uniref:Caspase-1 n=1 Tax=Saguinus oedipus TaxID=9490 RepID=A0ABQ9URL3_SAGOE|nr:hypothetical protein P7K49_020753 [Saguinus oedipus]